jgi:hypothetical protein
MDTLNVHNSAKYNWRALALINGSITFNRFSQSFEMEYPLSCSLLVLVFGHSARVCWCVTFETFEQIQLDQNPKQRGHSNQRGGARLKKLWRWNAF